jgi:6-phosphofructokinase 1
MKKIAILTSGGDSPGMNPAVRAVTRAGLNFDLEIIGIMNGYQGILEEDFIKLDSLRVSGANRVPGTFLQTSRCAEFRTEAGQLKALEILKKHHIDALVIVGGDGSLTGAQKLHQLGFPVIGMPGTIDNDLFGTEMAIGVDTCLNTIISLVDMIKATAASHRRCFVVEVMGRNSGYLALMTTISSGCQVAVIPEFRVNHERIVEVMHQRESHKHNNSVIIIAEGVCSGADFMQTMSSRFPNTIKQEMRLTVLGHVQRGGVPTHFDRLLASRMGEMAVLALKNGESGCMIGQVGGKIQLRDLNDILGKHKALPGDAIRLARNLGIELGDVVET